MDSRPPYPPYTVTDPENGMLVTDYRIDYAICVHGFIPWRWLVVTFLADRRESGWIYRYLFGSILRGTLTERGGGSGTSPIGDCFQWRYVLALTDW